MTDAPKDGSVFNTYFRQTCRWKPYKPASQQYKHGKRGRWQFANGYGGWENAPNNFEPTDWEPANRRAVDEAI